MKNKYEQFEKHTVIFIKQRTGRIYECLISNEDFELVSQHTWHVQWSNKIKGYYVSTTFHMGTENGKQKAKTILLHKLILNVLDVNRKIQVDHKNFNTLDNRRENIEVVSTSQNSLHRKGANKNSTTKVKNISWSKSTQRYLVQFQVNHKNVCFGRFKTLDEAKEKANCIRKILYKTEEN
jgi:hypothetical protein